MVGIAAQAAKPSAEIARIDGGPLQIHGMTDARNGHQAAVRQGLGHPLEIGWRDPAVVLTPKHQMRMPDFRHPSLQLTSFAFAVEMEGRSHPDALRNAECLVHYSFERSLHLSEPVAKHWRGIRRQAFGDKQR